MLLSCSFISIIVYLSHLGPFWEAGRRGANQKNIQGLEFQQKRNIKSVLEVTWRSAERNIKSVLEATWRSAERNIKSVLEVTWRSAERNIKSVLKLLEEVQSVTSRAC